MSRRGTRSGRAPGSADAKGKNRRRPISFYPVTALRPAVISSKIKANRQNQGRAGSNMMERTETAGGGLSFLLSHRHFRRGRTAESRRQALAERSRRPKIFSNPMTRPFASGLFCRMLSILVLQDKGDFIPGSLPAFKGRGRRIVSFKMACFLNCFIWSVSSP